MNVRLGSHIGPLAQDGHTWLNAVLFEFIIILSFTLHFENEIQ